MKTLTLLTTIILAALTATAQIIHVPADQPTIQQGIDAASDGDTVLVAEGTYYENINFNGKAITVASEFIMDNDTSHISNTIIDGSQPEDPDLGSVVTLESGEDISSILTGYTITGGTGSIVPGYNYRVGGGINMVNSGASILDNIIDNNNITHQNPAFGGGIDAMSTIEPASWLILSNNKITNNSVTSTIDAQGGGVLLGMNAQIINNDINNNELLSQGSYSYGGGIRIAPAFVPIEVETIGNYITHNSAVSISESKGGIGGGFYITSFFGLTASVSGNTIEYNEVRGDYSYGAGAFVRKAASDFVFENNIIRNNNTIEGECSGGGLTVWYGGGTYQNNVIQNNTGTWGGGICVVRNNSDSLAILVNNTVTGNSAAYGGGLYNYLAEAVVINTILWNNEASEEGPEIFKLESNLEVRHSDIEGGWPGNGNMDVDPQFRSDGYHLDYPSTLLNEGTLSILINGEWYVSPEYDIDGDDRPYSTAPEIGADEALWNYVSVDESISTTNSLSVSPNPFSTSICIGYELKQPARVQIVIYNYLGEQVEVILEEYQPQGIHQLAWTSETLPAGVYYCMLKTNKEIQTVKIIKR